MKFIPDDESANYTSAVVFTSVGFFLVALMATLVFVLIMYWKRKGRSNNPIRSDPDSQRKLNSTADKTMLSLQKVPQKMKETMAYLTHPHQDHHQE